MTSLRSSDDIGGQQQVKYYCRIHTTFENWASELQTYMSLEDHTLIDIMENVRCETTPITV
eukprot:2256029-Amphidinium_carterae.1